MVIGAASWSRIVQPHGNHKTEKPNSRQEAERGRGQGQEADQTLTRLPLLQFLEALKTA